MASIHSSLSKVESLRYILNLHEFLSFPGKQKAMNQEFITDKEKLKQELQQVDFYINLLKNKDLDKAVQQIEFQIHQLEDIGFTISKAEKNQLLCDIDLFEIKKLTLISEKIREIAFEIPEISPTLSDIEELLKILDPENKRTLDFYIYNEYSEELSKARKIYDKEKDETKKSAHLAKITELEDEIRERISKAVHRFYNKIARNFHIIAYMDFVIAKARFAMKYNFSKPEISNDKTTFVNIFHPEVKQNLAEKGKLFQKINISYDQSPVLITGANMGGKTVLLKSIQLCQFLFQYGFYVPAEKAHIALVNKVLTNFDDKQDIHAGLSSFGAEILNLDKIVKTIRKNSNVLVLLDEPANTTNPTEGSAIVNAMVSILEKYDVRSIVTTHYDNIKSKCRRLRVLGLKKDANYNIDNVSDLNNFMDYSLVEENAQVPLNALDIAQILKVDEELISVAKSNL